MLIPKTILLELFKQQFDIWLDLTIHMQRASQVYPLDG